MSFLHRGWLGGVTVGRFHSVLCWIPPPPLLFPLFHLPFDLFFYHPPLLLYLSYILSPLRSCLQPIVFFLLNSLMKKMSFSFTSHSLRHLLIFYLFTFMLISDESHPCLIFSHLALFFVYIPILILISLSYFHSFFSNPNDYYKFTFILIFSLPKLFYPKLVLNFK